MNLRLSILDQSPIPAGATPAHALAATLDLARVADTLGYHRYWVAEHHNSPSFAGTSPEILAATLLDRTQNLRVGTGGVLLPRYSALKVAEDFRLLTYLHPGRVDLGIGRAGGIADHFPEQVRDLLHHLAKPCDGYTPPPVWLLGAGTSSAGLAAELGTHFSYAHFLNPRLGGAAFDALRRGARSNDPIGASLAVRVITADTEAKAAELATSYLLWRSRKDLGHDEPIPSPSAARAHRWTGDEAQRAAHNRRAVIVGEPEQVHTALNTLAQTYGVDELVINTITHHPTDRLRSYELLSELFLTPAPIALR
ncbi:MsnO8 family LLM class oxidoreductase [Streptomyces sp. RB6PN25]|uniref:MsnO8 family LLM class oxidoreductase n=1 Tax=Streptomyces humicola TaxID=2953240 RepID=A0ABT1PT67_9ACTN|nr:MsnO8 family LLM class oxidoreductase [Streptomyces humicola]MCQ4079745.1 MsnO8 family LLM class oxidoreductase [Streptomyces humicola]